MAHYSKAQLANILEMIHITSEMKKKHAQKQQLKKTTNESEVHKEVKRPKRPRIKVKVSNCVPITSSDRRKAFWMNEWRITHPEKCVEKPRKKIAYYKVFGREIIIDDKEINVFIEHNVTIYYK